VLPAAAPGYSVPVMEADTSGAGYEPPAVEDLDADGPASVCAMITISPTE